MTGQAWAPGPVVLIPVLLVFVMLWGREVRDMLREHRTGQARRARAAAHRRRRQLERAGGIR